MRITKKFTNIFTCVEYYLAAGYSINESIKISEKLLGLDKLNDIKEVSSDENYFIYWLINQKKNKINENIIFDIFKANFPPHTKGIIRGYHLDIVIGHINNKWCEMGFCFPNEGVLSTSLEITSVYLLNGSYIKEMNIIIFPAIIRIINKICELKKISLDENKLLILNILTEFEQEFSLIKPKIDRPEGIEFLNLFCSEYVINYTNSKLI